VKLIGGVLLLYFGQRLIKSARRSVLNSRRNKLSTTDHFEKGVMSTGFSVGAIEAFEAAIVLVGLLPYNYQSTVAGMGLAIVVVVAATYVLRNQVRKVKQANMKVVVSALLLSFPTLWFLSVALLYSGLLFVPLSRQVIQRQTLLSILTTPTNLENLLLLPIFLIYVFAVYKFANRPTPQVTSVAAGGQAPAGS
jgi:ferrous iron uptake permease (iron-lead transporter)